LPTCLIHIHSGENVLDKVLTVVGADWFNRRRGLLPANAIFINQSFMTWGLREELSSTSLFRRYRAVLSDIRLLPRSRRLRRRDPKICISKSDLLNFTMQTGKLGRRSASDTNPHND
jgi:hypothetical protein